MTSGSDAVIVPADDLLLGTPGPFLDPAPGLQYLHIGFDQVLGGFDPDARRNARVVRGRQSRVQRFLEAKDQAVVQVRKDVDVFQIGIHSDEGRGHGNLAYLLISAIIASEMFTSE